LLVLASVAVGATLLPMSAAMAPAALQQACPNEFRGQVFAVYLGVVSAFGYAIGPLVIPLITDAVLHDEMKLNLSLALVAFFLLPIAAATFRLAERFAPAELTPIE
jgi:MFS family permease